MSKLTIKEKSDLIELITFLSTMSNTTVTLDGVTLCSQKNVYEYNKQMKKFKKRYEKLEKDLRGDKDV